jgi:hypothetical protein
LRRWRRRFPHDQPGRKDRIARRKDCSGLILWATDPVFTCDDTVSAVAIREMAQKPILRALGQTPMMRTDLRRAGRATLAPAGTLGGQQIQPIRDITALSDVPVFLDDSGKAKSVTTLPDGPAIPVSIDASRGHFIHHDMRGNAML